jgi:hypothetical protein
MFTGAVVLALYTLLSVDAMMSSSALILGLKIKY